MKKESSHGAGADTSKESKSSLDSWSCSLGTVCARVSVTFPPRGHVAVGIVKRLHVGRMLRRRWSSRGWILVTIQIWKQLSISSATWTPCMPNIVVSDRRSFLRLV
jgi:hypothetical protein